MLSVRAPPCTSHSQGIFRPLYLCLLLWIFTWKSQRLPELLNSYTRHLFGYVQQKGRPYPYSQALQILTIACQCVQENGTQHVATAVSDISSAQIGSDTLPKQLSFSHLFAAVHKGSTARNPNHKTTHTPSTVCTTVS